MKYSVIIPIYNAEKTLHRCLDALAAQDYADVEFLLVDDGSSDKSASICLEYTARDSRFRLISKANGGVSTARNLGLEQARGEFILFADSDDYVLPGYFAALDAADPGGLYDYLIFSYRRSDGTAVCHQPFASADPALYGPKLAWGYRVKHINSPWNKRFRRSLLNTYGIRFHEALPIAEDTLFNLQYLLHSRSLCTTDAMLYCVSLENPDSLSRKPLKNRHTLLALADREALQAIESAPISEAFRSLMLQSRNFLLLSDIYSEAKQLHLTSTSLPERWHALFDLCRDFNRHKLDLPGDLRSRLLTIPVKLCIVPVIDLLGKHLAR